MSGLSLDGVFSQRHVEAPSLSPITFLGIPRGIPGLGATASPEASQTFVNWCRLPYHNLPWIGGYHVDTWNPNHRAPTGEGLTEVSFLKS